jgi:hypothetical protein
MTVVCIVSYYHESGYVSTHAYYLNSIYVTVCTTRVAWHLREYPVLSVSKKKRSRPDEE